MPSSAQPAAAREIPLILGGHSFITQLGNDLPASEQDQYSIIESCLNCGIRWIDTTYQPERIRLGHMLQRLGRREEVTILAWSFFKDFTPTEPVGEPERYRPEHIEIILEQLHTTYVNGLVVIPVKNPERNQEQIELTIGWRKKGYVRSLGLWVAELAATDFDQYRETNAFQFAVLPVNITTPSAAATLVACKKNGLETLATSPFFRGWELERMVTEGCARGYGDREVVLRQVADLMLRFSLFHSDVDRVIVGIRRLAWISRNVESVSRGPLTAGEYRWLRRLHAHAERRRWWQRLRRHLARPFSLRY
jgi:aryl-alcohol dehydrogenase-like predicted oxidoreductase